MQPFIYNIQFVEYQFKQNQSLMKSSGHNTKLHPLKLRTLQKQSFFHKALNPEVICNSDQPSDHESPEIYQPLTHKAIQSKKKYQPIDNELLPNIPPSLDVMKKLEALDSKAEQLIAKRLSSLVEGSRDSTKKLEDQLGPQFQKLVYEIKRLKDNELNQQKYSMHELQDYMQKKINLLEKLMAEKAMESEVLKKYHFSMLTLNRSKKSYNKKMKSLLAKYKTNEANPTSIAVQKTPSNICDETWNRNSFKVPTPQSYERYRYSPPEFKANHQPFPRSSYKAQYLLYGNEDQRIKCVNSSHHVTLKGNRNTGSTYSRDFINQKTDPINYKELDSYRNKIKNLQISYNTKKDENQYDTVSYMKDRETERNLFDEKSRSAKRERKAQQDFEAFKHSRVSISTESRSQYTGLKNQMGSRIKDKSLNTLKYAYKSLVYA